MTTRELSNKFDTLVNSYASQESFGQNSNPLNFDEYEKSVFLTKAQEEVIQNLYTGKLIGDSFEETEQLRRYLADLVKTEYIPTNDSSKGLSDKSVFVDLPKDIWFITYESAIIESDSLCLNGKNIEIIPVTQDEYHRVKNNPFRKPNSRKALRLDIGDSKVELISEEPISQYIIRYIARPEPIILTDLPDELVINNQSKQTECKLNPDIYRMILDMAVNMAIQSRISSTGK